MRKGSSKEWPLIDAYGIVRQSVLPLYLRPTEDSALVTQLLFGECYLITGLTSDRDWFRVSHTDSGYSGWVGAKSIKEITAEAYDTFLNQDFQVVTSPMAAIEYQGASLYLLPGSRLHFSENELFNWQDHLGFMGTYRPHALKAGREELVDLGLRFLHAPFQAGGRSIFGLDAQHAFPLLVAMAGYTWPADHLPGLRISPEAAVPGDLMVVKVGAVPLVAHFGLYLGAEELLWMDHRMQVTDMRDWEDFLDDRFGEAAVFETYAIVG